MESKSRIWKILWQLKRNVAITFNRSEIKFKYDENKNPIDVTYRTKSTSEKIIEKFMLAANKKIHL